VQLAVNSHSVMIAILQGSPSQPRSGRRITVLEGGDALLPPRAGNFPQRLKPDGILGFYGTSELVPFPDALMRSWFRVPYWFDATHEGWCC
jgi:hypothetical protein